MNIGVEVIVVVVSAFAGCGYPNYEGNAVVTIVLAGGYIFDEIVLPDTKNSVTKVILKNTFQQTKRSEFPSYSPCLPKWANT
ncbi:hypothetical protein EV207_12211 [Scopulibacillus darangshiensis]|uniref:Uncharacterized protein n=1 Tax=Scopulibacillus darangshiensis TaxID=442528 RepID=A0A4R2NTW7_9BACL|nr:hypothetical protein [Scopulibacillus darangshiensis]TCP24908.1 hypothetical protein EV207_12211 [Scopulibacillus darangshiensis]